jgi:peroxin-4
MAQRLMRELREVQRAEEMDLELVPSPESIFEWTCILTGPNGTPFEGGKFRIMLHCTKQYPLAPPTAVFQTKIFHPNIHYKTGEVCLDILKTSWSPAWTLQSVCRAISALLAHPEPDSPLNCDAGNLLRARDVRGYKSLARMYTLLYAQ